MAKERELYCAGYFASGPVEGRANTFGAIRRVGRQALFFLEKNGVRGGKPFVKKVVKHELKHAGGVARTRVVCPQSIALSLAVLVGPEGAWLEVDGRYSIHGDITEEQAFAILSAPSDPSRRDQKMIVKLCARRDSNPRPTA